MKGKITNYKLCPEAELCWSWNVLCTVAGVCLLKLDTLVLCTYGRCSEGVGVIYSTYFYYLLITENHRLSTLPYVNFVNVCLNRFTCVTLFESLIWLKGRGQMFSRLSWHVFDHGVNVWHIRHMYLGRGSYSEFLTKSLRKMRKLRVFWLKSLDLRNINNMWCIKFGWKDHVLCVCYAADIFCLAIIASLKVFNTQDFWILPCAVCHTLVYLFVNISNLDKFANFSFGVGIFN